VSLRLALVECFEQFTPDVIYYNAGTDVLQGDPLGAMSITPDGVIKRDEIIFR
jgi:histone deacetylase 11